MILPRQKLELKSGKSLVCQKSTAFPMKQLALFNWFFFQVHLIHFHLLMNCFSKQVSKICQVNNYFHYFRVINVFQNFFFYHPTEYQLNIMILICLFPGIWYFALFMNIIYRFLFNLGLPEKQFSSQYYGKNSIMCLQVS